MGTEIPQDNENEETADSPRDWDNRILCSDGNCIGVIGADGRCKECGKQYEGPLPEKSRVEKPETNTVEKEEQAVDEDEEVPTGSVEANPPDESPAEDVWEDRVLCSDGNCIGVIGPDGKCKECGKPLE